MTHPSRLGVTGRIARSAARHPVYTVMVWALALAASAAVAFAGVTGQTLTERLDTVWSFGEGESTRADELLTDATGETVTLLIHGIDLTEHNRSLLAGHTERLTEDLAQLADTQVLDPLAFPVMPDGSPTAQLAPFFAEDGRGVLILATVAEHTADGDDAGAQATVAAVIEAMTLVQTQIRADFSDATVEVGGATLLAESLSAVASDDLARGEAVALPIAVLVMLIVFGGFLAAGLPIIGAIAAIIGSFGVLFGYTHFIGVGTEVVNVVTAVGLGLSIDYGLLIVSRFREEARAMLPADTLQRSRAGRPARAAQIEVIVRTAETSGRTVLYSGTTFAIASLSLLLFDSDIIRAIGLGAFAVTALAVCSALTLVPALLGPRLLRPGALTRLPGVHGALTRFGDVAPAAGFFSALTRRVQRHPALVTIAGFAVLLLLGSPVLGLRLAITTADAVPASATQHAFTSALAEHFPRVAPQRVILVTDAEAAANAWAAEASQYADVTHVTAAEPINQVWRVGVQVRVKQGATVVHQLRADRPDSAAATHLVTGTDARTTDFAALLMHGVPWVVLVIVLGTMLLLFLMTGSLIVPLKALLMSALSLGASLGVLVWGFQHGQLAELMGFDQADVAGVDTVALILTLVFGFGLAMDYEMFILSRITEQVRRGVPAGEAIALGLQRSGRIITSAALIIIIVFAGFATGDLMVIKQLGTALAVAVFIDATLVRCLLVPAFMTWQQRIMWWAPQPLRRLHARFALRD